MTRILLTRLALAGGVFVATLAALLIYAAMQPATPVATGSPTLLTLNGQSLYVNRNSTQPAANLKQTGAGYALVISSNPTPNGAATPQAWFLKDGQLIAPFNKPPVTMTPTSTNTPTATPTNT